MSAELVGLIGVIIVVVLMLFFRMWIGLAMALVGSLGILILQGFKQTFGVMGTVPYETVAYYPMAALPLFVLMGVIVGNTSIGEDLYYAVYKWVGALRGGLASATVLACAVFASVTGSSATGTVLMGKVALPQMRKYKYDDAMASGCIASAGTMGILIPPSMGFILYGLLTEQSIGKLFMAGFLPGILLTLLMIIAILIITAIRPEAGPAGPKSTLKEKVVSLRKIWHVMLLFLLVLGGIYGGMFTPTEAGAIGAFGALVIVIATRQLTRRSLHGDTQRSDDDLGHDLPCCCRGFYFYEVSGPQQTAFCAGQNHRTSSGFQIRHFCRNHLSLYPSRDVPGNLFGCDLYDSDDLPGDCCPGV